MIALKQYYPGICLMVSDDGSVDGTGAIVRSFQKDCENIFFLDRKRERIHGLTASVLAASAHVATKYFIVMDADRQHPPEKVKEIVTALESGMQLTIASRTSIQGYWPVQRRAISLLGNALGRMCLCAHYKRLFFLDVLSGFFGVRTSFWKKIVFESEGDRLFRPRGYKILFDFLKVMPRHTSIQNIPYMIDMRHEGASKLTPRVYVEYFKALMLPGWFRRKREEGDHE